MIVHATRSTISDSCSACGLTSHSHHILSARLSSIWSQVPLVKDSVTVRMCVLTILLFPLRLTSRCLGLSLLDIFHACNRWIWADCLFFCRGLMFELYLPWISNFESALVSTLRVCRLQFPASNIEIQPVLIHHIKPAQTMNDPRYPFTGLLHISLLILALPFISPIGPLRNIYRWIPAIRYAPLYAAPLVLDSSFLTPVSNAGAAHLYI